jgi:hypothetical protein
MDDGEDDLAFEAYERSPPRMRSLLEAERERIAKGHTPDIALQMRGADIELEILRSLERGADGLVRQAEILVLPSRDTTDDA